MMAGNTGALALKHTDDPNGCRLCPRMCGVRRDRGERGFCGMGSEAVVSKAYLHMWEEPCISGKNGSGTVFFCGCSLQCVFCQNRAISDPKRFNRNNDDPLPKVPEAAYMTVDEWHRRREDADRPDTVGIIVNEEELKEIFFGLKEKGAENINLVTPTHFADCIGRAVKSAKEEGLDIPVVYNCGGYESTETLKKLEGLIDVWMPDLKYYSDDLSVRYSRVPHYFEAASKALEEMVRQTGGINIFDERGMMKKGVIVRYLVLPGHTADSKHIIRYLHETFGDSVYISIMNQFTPLGDLHEYPEINRKLTQEEYRRVVDFAERIGVVNGFIQEGDTQQESFIPAFDGSGI